MEDGGGHRRISLESVRRALRERDVDVSRPIAPEGSEDLFTVLVVDDDPHMLRLQLHQLSRLGLPIRAIPAENGFLGLLQVGRRRPDLVHTSYARRQYRNQTARSERRPAVR